MNLEKLIWKPVMSLHMDFDTGSDPTTEYIFLLEMKQGQCICPLSWSVHCNFTGDSKCNDREVGVHPPPSSAWANFTLMMECTPESTVTTLWIQHQEDPASIATLPLFGPIEGHKWFFQTSSQWESQKNRFAFISFGKIHFLPPCIWDLPGCFSETGPGVHIVMERIFVCLWRRHNCNWYFPFSADLLIYEINYCVFKQFLYSCNNFYIINN